MNNWQKGESILSSIDTLALSSESQYDYTYLSIGSHIHNQKWSDALSLYQQLKRDSLNFIWKCLDEATLGYVYARLGKFDKAHAAIKNALSASSSKTDTFNISYYKAKIDLLENKDFESLKSVEDHLRYAYAQSADKIHNHISVGQGDYHRFRAENEALKNQLYISYIFLGTSLFVIVLGVIISLTIRFRRRKINELNALALSNESLKNQISDLERHESSVHKYYHDAVSSLRSAFTTGFSKINQISKKKFANERNYSSIASTFSNGTAATSDAGKSFMADISKIISELDSPIVFKTLESSLNYVEDNIMHHFRNDFPKISEQELKLAILIFSNIGSHTISLILNLPNLEALRNRKTRLKKNIERTESPYREIYLSKFK